MNGQNLLFLSHLRDICTTFYVYFIPLKLWGSDFFMLLVGVQGYHRQ